MNSLRRVHLAQFLLAILLSWTNLQAEVVPLDQLTAETQKSTAKPGEVSLIWWIPEEFWAASFEQQPEMTKDQIDDFLATVRLYTTIAVADGIIGDDLTVSYASEDSLRDILRIVDATGHSYGPISNDAIEPRMKYLLDALRPFFGSTLGQMGENLNILVFPAKTDHGRPIAAASGVGHFSVMLGTREFRWRLPLDALLPTQTCMRCNEDCKGSWKYCPWCGGEVAPR